MPADRPSVRGIDHVQITIPVGAEDEARRFYLTVLGLTEIAKPESLAGRGGFWCKAGDVQVHIGTEDGFDRLTTKAHIAYAIRDIPYWRERLLATGCQIIESIPIPGYDRFEFRDPFGNRVEFIQALVQL